MKEKELWEKAREKLHNFAADEYDADNGRRNLSRFVLRLKNKIDEVFDE